MEPNGASLTAAIPEVVSENNTSEEEAFVVVLDMHPDLMDAVEQLGTTSNVSV